MPSFLSNSLCDLLDPMTLLASSIPMEKLQQEKTGYLVDGEGQFTLEYSM